MLSSPCRTALSAIFAGLVVAAATPAVAAASTVAAEALLIAPPTAETEVDALLSSPVQSIPAAASQPVRKGELLAVIDITKLEMELEATRRTLISVQAEKRRRITDRPVPRAGTTSSRGFEEPTTSRDMELAQAETSAMSEITDLQSRIASAAMRAPADGYVVRYLYAVGAKAKRRKPFLIFAEAQKTTLETSLGSGDAAPFVPGAEVRVASVADPALAFRGRVESATPSGDAVALRIRPLELPFLPLGSAAQVTLSATR